jgi:hypothetical protein
MSKRKERIAFQLMLAEIFYNQISNAVFERKAFRFREITSTDTRTLFVLCKFGYFSIFFYFNIFKKLKRAQCKHVFMRLRPCDQYKLAPLSIKKLKYKNSSTNFVPSPLYTYMWS